MTHTRLLIKFLIVFITLCLFSNFVTADTDNYFMNFNIPAPDINYSCPYSRCVNETGWWNASSTFNASALPITAAESNSSAFDTVYVYNGSYTETITITQNNISIVGEGSDLVNLTGNIKIPNDADYVNVSGFNVTGFGGASYGISIDSDYSNVSYNEISNGGIGIPVGGSYNQFINNTVSSTTYGVLNGYDFEIGLSGGNYNQFINTTIINNTLHGFNSNNGLYSSVIGGSIDTSGEYDYYCNVFGCGTVTSLDSEYIDDGIYFNNTNFTIGTTRKIYLSAGKLLNITSDNITILTGRNSPGETSNMIFNRTIYNMTSANVTFKDSGLYWRGYRINGLMPDSNFLYYKNDVLQSVLTTNATGYLDYFSNTDTSDATIKIVFSYVPPTPVMGTVTTGNFFKNITWTAGIGDVTDSYNVSRNDTWYNGTDLYLNTTTDPHGYINDTICAYNATSDMLSISCLTNNTRIPNNNPTLTGLPNSNTNEDTDIIGAFDLDTYFADPDNDTPTYQVQSNDQSDDVTVTINGDNTVDYTIDANWYGTANIVFNVSDGYGGTANDTIVLTVNSVNDDPIISPAIGNLNIAEGDSLPIDLDATDVDSAPLTYWTNRTDLVTAWDTGDGTGLILANYTSAGVYSIRFWVDDGDGGDDEEIITLTITDTPLSITSYWNNVSGASLSVSALVDASIEFGVTTNRSAENITWYRDLVFAENDSTTAQGNYTTSWPDAGTYYVNVSATNNSDTTSNTTFTVTISDADSTAPEIYNLTNSTPSSSGVTITWDTNESCNSLVCYGTNETEVNAWTNCTNSSWDNGTAAVSIPLSGLAENTTYFYRPYSEDLEGNANTTVAALDFTTTTAPDANIPLSIFIMWTVIALAGAFIGFTQTGLLGITSSLFSVIIAYMNSKLIISGNVVQYFSGISSTDTIVVGTRSIESLPISYILLFIAIVMLGVFILQVKNEIQYQLEPVVGDIDLE